MAQVNLGRVGFVNKGAYSSATTYKVNDVVVYNSGTYACIQANTGQEPTNTSYWQNWVADNAVHKTGDETIAGVKTFSNNLVFESGTKIQGDFSNATHNLRTVFQTSVTNGATAPFFIPNGTGYSGAVVVGCSSNASNTSYLSLISSSATATNTIMSYATGTGAMFPLLFNTGGSERLRIDTSGNVLVTGSGGLGYGTGSGGTVTQLTSKSTAVTLNKPSGYITMNNAALAAGASVAFIFNNSIISYSDQILITRATTGTTAGYNLWIDSVGAGACTIAVKNITGVSLSEAIVLSYSIIKGAAS